MGRVLKGNVPAREPIAFMSIQWYTAIKILILTVKSA